MLCRPKFRPHQRQAGVALAVLQNDLRGVMVRLVEIGDGSLARHARSSG
jgi:hypothetical protein